MVIFNSYVSLPEGKIFIHLHTFLGRHDVFLGTCDFKGFGMFWKPLGSIADVKHIDKQIHDKE